jgi:hypothetical protein
LNKHGSVEDRVLASESTLYFSPPRRQPSTSLHIDDNPLLLSTSTSTLYFSLLFKLVPADLATLHRRISKME